MAYEEPCFDPCGRGLEAWPKTDFYKILFFLGFWRSMSLANSMVGVRRPKQQPALQSCCMGQRPAGELAKAPRTRVEVAVVAPAFVRPLQAWHCLARKCRAAPGLGEGQRGDHND